MTGVRLLASASALLLLGCVIPDREPETDDLTIQTVPGLRNPEDLVAAPGSDWLIVSQMASGEGSAGSLAGLDTASGRKAELYPPPATRRTTIRTTRASGCPGPPDPARFAPHGIDVSASPRGPAVLLVVNHGAGNERVDLFELRTGDDGPALTWRDCVPVPGGVSPNDVVALPDGALAITNMIGHRRWSPLWWGQLRMSLGWDTGDVRIWQPQRGWHRVAGSQGSGPNGIAASADGSTLFVAEYGARRIRSVRTRGGGVMTSARLRFRPDNLSWSEGGRLLAAGQAGPLSRLVRCFEDTGDHCPVPFGVASLEPSTLALSGQIASDGRRGIGAATVALQHGRRLYLGTFRGKHAAWIAADVLLEGF